MTFELSECLYVEIYSWALILIFLCAHVLMLISLDLIQYKHDKCSFVCLYTRIINFIYTSFNIKHAIVVQNSICQFDDIREYLQELGHAQTNRIVKQNT